MAERPRALVVEADPMYRATLRMALGAHVQVVGEVNDEEEACAFTSTEPVELVVMSLPRPSGFDAARELLERDPALTVVLLSRRVDDDEPAAVGAHAAAPPSADLRELAGLLVGLGSAPRPPTGG